LVFLCHPDEGGIRYGRRIVVQNSSHNLVVIARRNDEAIPCTSRLPYARIS
jgi:hypothetical protein